MSSVASFKQTCPSCGGAITIKNPELVGKKVDCPKCKYRFVVETPDGDLGDLEVRNGSAPPARTKREKKKPGAPARLKGKRPRDDDEDDGTAKKGKKSNKGLLIMAAVGVGVLVIVGIVLIFTLPGGDDKLKPAPTPPSKTTDTAEKKEPEDLGAKIRELLAKGDQPSREEALNLLTDENQEKADQALAVFEEEMASKANDHGSADSFIDKFGAGLDAAKLNKLKSAMDGRIASRYGPRDLADEPTNMLPGDTQVVLSVFANKFINGTFGQAVFARGAFKVSDFDSRLGLRTESIEQLVIGANKDHNHVLVVIRTGEPYDFAEVKKALRVESAAKKTQKGKEYWLGKVDFLVEILDKRFPLAGLKSQAAIYAKNQRTLVYGDETTIQKFLDEPPPFTVTAPAPAAGSGGPPARNPSTPAGGGGPGGGNLGGAGGAPPGYPGAPAGGGPGGGNLGGAGAGASGGPGGGNLGGAGGGAPAGRSDGTEGGGSNPAGGRGAGPTGGYPGAPAGYQPGRPGGPAGGAPAVPSSDERYYLTINKSLRRLIDVAMQKKQPVLVYADASKNPIPASTFYYFEKLAGTQQRLIDMMAMALHIDENVVLRLAALCKDKKDVDPVKRELQKLLTDAAKGELRDALGFEFQVSDAGEVATSSGGNQYGPGGGYPGAPPGYPGGPGGLSGTGPGAGGGGPTLPPPPTGGGAGRAPGAPNLPPPPGGQGRPGGGAGAGALGGAEDPTSGFPRPGGGENAVQADQSTIQVGKQEEIITLVVTVKEKSEQAFVDDKLGPRAAEIRAQTDMRSGRMRFGDLGSSLRPYSSAKQDNFPPGALPRKPDPTRGLRPWPPSERVSWMRELLPYLGDNSYVNLYQDINPDKSWRDDDNQKAGRYLISQFVNPNSGNYFTKIRGVNQRMAVTHFVGMAGIGPDAPYYAKNDPRAGIFGYDRNTVLTDIKDGLSHTIYMIQTDSALAGPWIAGGGATVRGTSEKGDDVGRRGGFLAPNAGKQGTWIIMADGSVRYLTKDVSPEVFKALCTMAGEEGRPELNAVAPETKFGPSVPVSAAPASKADEKKEPAKAPAAKDEEEKKSPAKKPGKNDEEEKKK